MTKNFLKQIQFSIPFMGLSDYQEFKLVKGYIPQKLDNLGSFSVQIIDKLNEATGLICRVVINPKREKNSIP